MDKNVSIVLAIVTFSMLMTATVNVIAQSREPTSANYQWHGEFVGFDANSRTITVKSRVVGEQALAELPKFKAGDRIVVIWSGYDTWGDAISRVVRHDTTKKWNDPFTVLVEFVAYEPERQYATFKFQVPPGSVAALKALKPGEWVTTISRHRPSSEVDEFVSVNPYVNASSRATTN